MNITGKSLFEAVREDIETFFALKNEYKVLAEFGGSKITCTGKGDKCRILLSEDFCKKEILDEDGLHFSLLIICHELAHYIHKHNEHQDESSKETRSIEDWADFFGAKIMMTVITFGIRTRKIYYRFPENAHTDKKIVSMGNALALLAKTFYNTDSEKYSNSISRVGFSVAGINSFLDIYFEDININRSIRVMSWIYDSPHMRPIIQNKCMSFMKGVDGISTIDSIHKKIQGVNFYISDGLMPRLIPYIGTAYNTTLEYRAKYIEFVKTEAKKQGLKID